jgi:hypothetical protein
LGKKGGDDAARGPGGRQRDDLASDYHNDDLVSGIDPLILNGDSDGFDGGIGVSHEPDHASVPDSSKARAIFEAQRRAETASERQVNIWDVDKPLAAQQSAQPQAPVAAEPTAELPVKSRRARNNRTRIIGFEKSSGDIVDLFEEQQSATPKNQVQFPVGWLLVIDGPGRGHCFSLFSGMAQIGRGEDQSVQLDFGDGAISRNNHAAVVFDPDEKKFILGHGGKANIVRLNGKAVVSNQDMVDGDKIKIGETTLMLKALCGAEFDWGAKAAGGEEDEDVAIA